MSKIKDFMNAASSTGCKVQDIVGFTSIDSVDGTQELVKLLRWVYLRYAAQFKRLTLEDALKRCDYLLDSGDIYEYWLKTHDDCDEVALVNLKTALLWTCYVVVRGEKRRVGLRYIQPAGGVPASDDIVDIHTGKIWNSFFIHGINDNDKCVSVRSNSTGRELKLDVLNKGMDTYEVLLSSLKER